TIEAPMVPQNGTSAAGHGPSIRCAATLDRRLFGIGSAARLSLPRGRLRRSRMTSPATGSRIAGGVPGPPRSFAFSLAVDHEKLIIVDEHNTLR
ncbi:MAG: hypothetical protein MI724_06135, partial [Spirochaetales bacterium]|nr:hypothetical protein [Spirochaetales bacterium]